MTDFTYMLGIFGAAFIPSLLVLFAVTRSQRSSGRWNTGLIEYAKGGLGLVMAPFHMLGFLGIRFLASQSELQSDSVSNGGGRYNRGLYDDYDNNGGWDGDWN
ncbi:MAG: hypothetical protein M3R24_02975 [Chloroflexota bacterium]|nr:hypothetical protein [Chloroflexota bacterium]